MRNIFLIVCFFLSLVSSAQEIKTWELADIPIRDPYILPVEKEGTYYLYSATRGELRGPNGRQGVCAYKSNDLKTWEGPFIVFENPEDFWADPNHGIWAPEVHLYKDKYYLFATFSNPADTIEIRSDGIPVALRGTQICIADNPMGPFKPFDLDKPTTPDNWSALDGTLWMEDGIPYMVFCHEWVQINEGTFEVAALKPNLSSFAEAPQTIFKTNDAAWVKRMDLLGIKYKGQVIPGYVSDGAFIHRLPSGKLICLTSSFGENKYSLSYALSESGKLAGQWTHPGKPLLSNGHGHGMLFRSFDGRLMLTCHFPNTSPSKAVIYEVEELEDVIRIAGELR
jgi:hypothetical protein